MKNLPTFNQFINESKLPSYDNVISAIEKIVKLKEDKVNEKEFYELDSAYHFYSNLKSKRKPEIDYRTLNYVLTQKLTSIQGIAIIESLPDAKVKEIKSGINYTLNNRCYGREPDLSYFYHQFEQKEFQSILNSLFKLIRSKISVLLKIHKITYDIRQSLRNQIIYEVFRTISISSRRRENIDFIEYIAEVDRYQKYFTKKQIQDAKTCMKYIKHIAVEGRESLEALEWERWDYSNDGEKVEWCAEEFPKEYAFISNYRKEIAEFSTEFLNNLVAIDKSLEE